MGHRTEEVWQQIHGEPSLHTVELDVVHEVFKAGWREQRD